MIQTKKTVFCLCLLHILFFCLYGVSSSVPFGKVQLNQQGQFVDSHGRVLIFRGINSVQKSPPWYTEDSIDLRHIKYYEDWGFNFVRLGCMWSGFYPDRDQLNASYVKVLQHSVDLYEQHGIYVLLDMHQDVISTKVDSYDGMPRWLVDSFPEPPSQLRFPWPLKDPGNGTRWYENYLTYETGEIFQSLYDNVSSSWDHWATFWKKVANTFVDVENVIGYELINEPWAGNIYLNPLRLLPGYAGRHNLLPVYDYLIQEIRKVDPTTLIFYEPVTWGYYMPGGGYQGTGFDHLPGGGTESPAKTVMSYHYYCFLLQNTDPETPYPHWEEVVCDDIFVRQLLTSVRTDQKIFKNGIFLTEFGLCAPNNETQTINTIECRLMLNLLDENLQSWAYWDSQFFNGTNDEPIWDQVSYFARTYPRATAGQPISLKFNDTTSEMNYQYFLNTSINAPTEIFLPINIHFGGSFDNVKVDIEPSGVLEYRFDEQKNLLLIEPQKDTSEEALHGQVVQVRVSRK